MPDQDRIVQQTAIAGRDAKQVAGNNNETNRNLIISVVFLIVLALGGLAWAFTFGFNHADQSPKIEERNKN